MGEARSVDHSSSPVSTSCLANLCPAMLKPGSTPAVPTMAFSVNMHEAVRRAVGARGGGGAGIKLVPCTLHGSAT